jgi:hypothetical protein
VSLTVTFFLMFLLSLEVSRSILGNSVSVYVNYNHNVNVIK